MNCPMHNLIFRSQAVGRTASCRCGSLSSVRSTATRSPGWSMGLPGCAAMTQDDSHSYVTPEQAAGRGRSTCCDFVTGLLRDFGLDDYYFELSTRDASKSDKFIGSGRAVGRPPPRLLEEGRARSSVSIWLPDPGGAAFYGPKISVQARDAIGRTWQMSTIQYDFNQPAPFRSGVRQAADGSRQEPVMIHSAKFGSIERFIGVLVEHYAGAFPPWLAPGAGAGHPDRRATTLDLPCMTSCRGGCAPRGCAWRSTSRTTGCRRRSATPNCRRCRSW